MATAKQLVPGIHEMGKRLAREGKISSPISVDRAQEIAELVYMLPTIDEEMAAIKTEIMRS